MCMTRHMGKSCKLQIFVKILMKFHNIFVSNVYSHPGFSLNDGHLKETNDQGVPKSPGENATDSEDGLSTVKQALQDAILENNHEAVKFCLGNGADPKSQFGTKKVSALLLAIDVGALKTVETLLKSGADVTVADSRGMTPLHLAAKLGLANIVPCLIAAGADVNAHNFIRKDGKGHETPLHLAAMGDHLEVLNQLIESGALVCKCCKGRLI